MGKYLKNFESHTDYIAFTQTEAFIRPNVSLCTQENGVHYNPIQYFYIRSNTKNVEDTVKVKYIYGMTYNIMDYLNTSGAYILPYCGYTLIENTNIEDNISLNPTITSMLTDNPYAFTPQIGNTYVVIQQSFGVTGILYPNARWIYNTSTNVLINYFILYYVPKNVNRCGMFINDEEYANDSSDSTKRVTISTKVTIGSNVFQRANSYVVRFDILNLLKTAKTVEILPFIETMDSVNVESHNIANCIVSEEADVTSLKVNDVSSSVSDNPSYPNFITLQSGD